VTAFVDAYGAGDREGMRACLADDRIVEIWMVDALPARSAQFWS
jgi:hypothetical protein